MKDCTELRSFSEKDEAFSVALINGSTRQATFFQRVSAHDAEVNWKAKISKLPENLFLMKVGANVIDVLQVRFWEYLLDCPNWLQVKPAQMRLANQSFDILVGARRVEATMKGA